MSARPRTRRRVHHKRIDDSLLIGVCNRFLEGCNAEEVAAWLRRQDETLDVGRTRIYSLLRDARDRGLFRLQARDADSLRRELADRLGRDPRRISVVGARGEVAADQVALRGAQVALDLLQELADGWQPATAVGRLVRMGLGGGHTLRLLAEHLATMLRREAGWPPVAVHALSSGFDPLAPQNAPITFLGAFGDVARQLVGLFSSGMLAPSEFEDIRNLPGVGESFALAKEIDLVITSLASARDPAGALSAFLAHGDDPRLRASREELERKGWLGDVLYEPYGPTGPIEAELPVRAVSVLSVADLRSWSTNPNRRVLLVVGPSESGRSKTDALLPVLTRPELDLWTHLVVDAPTAEGVLDSLGGAPPTRRA